MTPRKPISAQEREKLKPRGRTQPSPTLDAFADLIAEGALPHEAAIQLGKCPDYGRRLLQKLIKRLGAQAV